MCGFTGIWNAENTDHIETRKLEAMTRVIIHRGPDSEGFYINNNVGLGFRRLSIIDLAAGNQPMCDLQERAWIVFNGEIYNYKELQKSLIRKGYHFKTQSDTEVILNAYLEYGLDFVDHLRGMYAFAIWDIKNNRMVLGRDRFGIKPLYYLLTNKRVVFGSEMKSILKSGYSNRQLDWQAVNSFFSYNYILNPISIYSDIKKLTPGHLLIIQSDGSTFQRKDKKYWQPTFTVDNSFSFEDYKIMIKEKLNETVKAHLVSDVPVGAFLSGGIDSNAVVSAMIKLYPEKVNTFSIGFKEPKYDEAILSKQSAVQYGTKHTELYLEKGSIDLIDKIIDMYDEPFADSSAIPTYFVSRLASEHVKVVLSGDGGDEMMGGYTTYQRLIKIQKYKNLIRYGSPLFKLASDAMPSGVRGKRFLNSLTNDPDIISAYAMEVDDVEKLKYFHPDVVSNISNNPASSIKLEYIKNSNSNDYISRMMELDISTFMVDDILTKVDRASMANSLEVRVPLIDQDFFEMASKIPSQMKIKGNIGKYIFREAVKDQIPDFIYNKPKTGFSIPVTEWFKNDLSEYVVNALHEAKDIGIFNQNYINTLLKTPNIGSLVTRIWPLVVFSTWYKRNIL